MKCLWIIGGGIEAVPSVRRAKEMGLFVVVADGNPEAPAFGLADAAVVVSTYDEEGMAGRAVSFSAHERRVDGVFSASADVPRTVARVAGALGLPGISRATAELAADKLAMKRHLRAAGIAVPDFWPVGSPDDLRACFERAGPRLVVKPVDSRGARGVLQLRPESDLAWAFGHAQAQSPTGRVMAETFVPGPQFSTESVLIAGAARTPAVIDRNYARLDQFAPFMIEDGGSQPSFLPAAATLPVMRLAEAAGRALGIDTGTVKGDLVLGPEGPVVIEMAARISGGWMATDQIPLHSGVDFIGLAIRLALGAAVDIAEAEPKSGPATTIRYFFPPPGLVRSLKIDPALIHQPWVRRFSLDLAPGDRVPLVTDHTRRAGFVLVTGDTRAEAVARAEALIAGVHIEIGSPSEAGTAAPADPGRS
ncbi:MAG: ATP-grasp domain-containing protein [Rhodospirillaceae bacterium]